MDANPFTIRQLEATDAPAYRALRLEGLFAHPEAFAASHADEAARPLAWFVERLTLNVVFGGWRDASTLLGIVGLAIPGTPKLSHKGVLWGMYVGPEARGTGLAPALVARIKQQAAMTLEEVRLTVTASNIPALRLYTSAGFTQYGLERRALKVGDQYYDELLMACPLP